MDPTFLFYDLETTGINPRTDRILQFAAIRTDQNLQPIGAPVTLYCKLPEEVLPEVQACLVTGLTPQVANERGLNEYDFCRSILKEMMQPNTCVLGYNSLRFDDEFIRYMLYRNLSDPYVREYANGNTRWDILDLVRLCCVVRPEILHWPVNEEGNFSFKLEALTKANGILHDNAHDALSDVRATIGLAKLIKDKRSQLFDYYRDFSQKKKAQAFIETQMNQQVLHVSGMFKSEYRCASMVVPLFFGEGRYANEAVCWNLRFTPPAAITKENLEELFRQGAIKSLHLNKSPAVIEKKHVSYDIMERTKVDPIDIEKNYQALKGKFAELATLVKKFLVARTFPPAQDAEHALYDGFLPDQDRNLLKGLLHDKVSEGTSLTNINWEEIKLTDPRAIELLWRLRAHTTFEQLSKAEQQKWHSYCSNKLQQGSLTLEGLAQQIKEKQQELKRDERAQQILQKLAEYVDTLSKKYLGQGAVSKDGPPVAKKARICV